MLIKEIKSRENKTFKESLKVTKLKKYRDLLDEFSAEGIKICQEILNSNVEVENLFFTKHTYIENKNFLNRLIKKSENSYLITDNLIKQLSNTTSPQEILCICKKPKNIVASLEKLLNKKNNSILILEDIQNPLNLGTILRTADAFGIKGVILNENCCELYNPKVLSGSMGSTFRLLFHFSEKLEKTVLELRKRLKVDVFSTTLSDDSLPLGKIKFPERCAVIIGNEGNGITQKVTDASNFKVKIPMSKGANSLNASIAAGIILWELRKNTRI